MKGNHILWLERVESTRVRAIVGKDRSKKPLVNKMKNNLTEIEYY